MAGFEVSTYGRFWVSTEVQCKDLPPAPDYTLRIEFDGPAHDPSLIRLVVEEIKTEAAAGAETDELVYQAVATCPTTPAVEGRAGVPLAALMAATKKSDRTVRRSLDRLIDAERCLVTGTMAKQRKLYGIKANESV